MKKALKITGISITSLILLILLVPYLIPGTISQEIETRINQNINGKAEFESTSLSFFTHFPSLTLSLNNFTLKGSAPFEKETLIHAKQLSFRLDLSTIFSKQVKINQIFLDQANINVQVDEKGNPNYNVYKSSNSTPNQSDGASTAIKIEGIFINKSNLTYNDQSIPMKVSAKGLNYAGKGDLSQAIFDLKSNARIDSLDLYYNNSPYLLNKKIDAKLVTKINTNSLDLMFNENDLKINTLPILFVGKFSFLKDGYDINFKTTAKETDLHNIFTVLPPSIANRMEKTTIKGYAEIKASLIGKYLAKQQIMPTLSFNIKVRDGNITNPKAPEAISNLYLNLQMKLPGLNPDSLYIDMDSLYFNMGKDYINSVVKLNGLKKPTVHINTRGSIDLTKWAEIFEVSNLKGIYTIDLKADGQFTKKVVRSGIRKVDTVNVIPKFTLKSSLRGGYFKYPSLNASIDQINFNINGHNTDGNYKHTQLDITDINLQALSNYIRGSASIQPGQMAIDVKLKSMVNLAEIKQFYPLKDLELNGELNMDLQSKGIYNKARKTFPVTAASFKLANGRIKTAHFDQPLTQIVVDGTLTNKNGTLRGTQVNIKPISFVMAGQPFMLKAAVRNFENVAYNITSKGTIDIGKMYQFFAVKGYNVKGTIFTDLSLKGLQSDATAGNYQKLNNRGRLIVNQINLQSDLFPKPFLIKNGVFSFAQDQMKFEKFKASYGQSDFTMDGQLGNIINYVLSPKAKLTGNFNFQSKRIFADELMVYNTPKPIPGAPAGSNGVILIPSNLDVTLSANAGTVYYNELQIKNAKGNLALKDGTLTLNQTSFNLIDAAVNMDATYKSITPKSAFFDYHITAKEFDIAKAYKEIKTFRTLATSASKVKGIVGLDYQLTGKLNQDMMPVYPSLKGAGVLSLKKVSLSGFKMMNAVSKATRRDSLNNPDLRDVEIKSTINKNIITIERFKMRIAGFRPRFEGQVSFDGHLNMSGRLGLPPFGLIGIPLTITGTQDKPIIKLKRNKEAKLEEKEEE
ncbi:AsmA protein [Pedobacter cryoconitis]|uniref:AsmA protein n=1 Tax=Pedobacter cryoconitis TaxID=188932 RepID=A0A7W9DZW3_9SPHI|nr:AsmA family protein [Pedobacter cryoconitis]MBB5637777.1 AsmA protein [Pedobacter cryoconitis]